VILQCGIVTTSVSNTDLIGLFRARRFERNCLGKEMVMPKRRFALIEEALNCAKAGPFSTISAKAQIQ
jgi:hypothetical protein